MLEVEATIKSMKNSKIEPTYEIELHDFRTLKDKLSMLGFKSKSSSKSLTIEFSNENQIADFLNYFFKIEC